MALAEHPGLQPERDMRDLQSLNQPNFARLRTFLKGVHVTVVIPGQPRDRRLDRPRPISDLIPQAGMQEFDKDGERLTVQVRAPVVYLASTLTLHNTPASLRVEIQSPRPLPAYRRHKKGQDGHHPCRVLPGRWRAGLQEEDPAPSPEDVP